MPAIIDPDQYGQWLDRSIRDPKMLQHLLVPYPAEDMEIYPVPQSVNKPANDRPEVVEPQT